MPKSPRFTDAHRFPVPYRDSKATDIAATFRRIRREQAAIELEAKQKQAAADQEALSKVREIRRKT